ncbi:hypothetical protein [Streptomyces maremycinicus]|uniref:hypothetical protein n=1 Tax=Streptomyces maremycinicus TaxID=1679753 RepID=UPI00078998FF|nr:hypothetical protein [Streptomyces sp. NBRC 110468]
MYGIGPGVSGPAHRSQFAETPRIAETHANRRLPVLLWTVLLVPALALFGLGFTQQHILWHLAVALLVAWVISFLLRGRFGGRIAGRNHR